jgi:hypothetical protein
MKAPSKLKKTDRTALDPNAFSLSDGLEWKDFADGDVYRLKRGKHYRGNLGAAKRSANLAALELGKAVRLVRDPLGKLHYIWVQFVDGEITMGNPCPCGSRKLERIHEQFLRCPACGRRLLARVATADSGSGTGKRGGGTHVGEFTDVQLSLYTRADGRELHRGHGYNRQGVKVLLIVRYPLGSDGQRIEDPDHEGEYIHNVTALAADPFGDAINFDAL